MTGIALSELNSMEKQLVTKSKDYQVIARQLYNLGADGIMRRCILEHERHKLLWEAHKGIAGGHNARKSIAHKVLLVRLWWPSIFRHVEQYCKACYICQHTRKLSQRNEMPLNLMITLESFDKWEIVFIGPINPPSRCIGAKYIITTT